MKIIDCCIYNGEDDLLDVRLNSLDAQVSRFVIVESDTSFTGIPKGYRFRAENFNKFKNKIEYVKIGGNKENYKDKKYWSSFKAEKWQREFYCRNSILEGLQGYAVDDDIILISDVDEIPNLVKLDLNVDVYSFKQQCAQLKLNLLNSGLTPYYGTKGIKFKHLGLPAEFRLYGREEFVDHIYGGLIAQTIQDGGWHFSYCMSAEKIMEKIKFYSHNERIDMISEDKIQKCIKEKKDIWDGEFNNIDKEVDLKLMDNVFLPKYVRDNISKFKHLLAENTDDK